MFCGVISEMKTNRINYGVGAGEYGNTLSVTRQTTASFVHRLHDLP